MAVITVINAGGSGTRLWPLSTPKYPKHLIRISNHERTMLQYAYERAKEAGDQVFVVTEAGHAHHIKQQLPELSEDKFIVEPARRGTASCLIATLVHLRAHCDPDEPIALLHADHFIRDVKGFGYSFRAAAEISKKTNQIVLIGIEPDYPSIGLGYIEKDDLLDEERLVFRVRSFTEKPDYETAKKYVKSGNYLWNGGYLIGSLNTFKNKLQAFAPHLYTDYQALAAAKSPEDYSRTYLGFTDESIEYAFSEFVRNDYLVIPASFDWMDIGSFDDLHKAVDSDEQGNHVSGSEVYLDDVENAFVHSINDKPVAIVGLDNIVVVNTKDGILVARKDLSKKIGNVSKRINNSGT